MHGLRSSVVFFLIHLLLAARVFTLLSKRKNKCFSLDLVLFFLTVNQAKNKQTKKVKGAYI